jgi:hypothetical protein
LRTIAALVRRGTRVLVVNLKAPIAVGLTVPESGLPGAALKRPSRFINDGENHDDDSLQISTRFHFHNCHGNGNRQRSTGAIRTSNDALWTANHA